MEVTAILQILRDLTKREAIEFLPLPQEGKGLPAMQADLDEITRQSLALWPL